MRTGRVDQPKHQNRGSIQVRIMYDLAFFIGRFQIFSQAHFEVVNLALTRAENVVLGIGSSLMPRTPKDPFTFDERVAMISECFDSDHLSRIHFKPIRDYYYSDPKWLDGANAAVSEVAKDLGLENPTVTLIGHRKDNSSYYLSKFPQYASLDVPNIDGINATDLRSAYFSNIGDLWLKNADGHRVGDKAIERLVPSGVKLWLERFIKTDAYRYVRNEQEGKIRHDMKYKELDYPPSFFSVDAIVEQSGHILLTERNVWPGVGTLALPGSMVGESEWSEDALIRTLKDKTRIKVPEAVLRGSIKATKLFEHPKRSIRGRVRSLSYYIKLPDSPELPKVRGGNGTNASFWVPRALIPLERLFEDHDEQIDIMRGLGADRGATSKY